MHLDLLSCFSHSAHWLPTRKKLLYTVANPARGLLNREKKKKKKKKKSGSAPSLPPPARAARSEKKIREMDKSGYTHPFFRQSGPVILVILCHSHWSSQGGMNVVVVVCLKKNLNAPRPSELFLTFSALVANPKKTTLHGGQSRSWSAEQGKKKKKKKKVL